MYLREFVPVLLAFVSFFYFSPVCADMLDGGEVRFRGQVTDTGPRWTWRVSSPDQNWEVDIADANASGEMLRFTLSEKAPLPFLEGRLHHVADQGGPGFSPQVTFSGQGKPLLLPAGGDTRSGRFRAVVPVKDPESGREVGHLAFTVEQGLAASFGSQSSGTGGEQISGMNLLTGGVVTQLPPEGLMPGLMSRLSSLLLDTPGFGDGMSAVPGGRVLPQTLLSSDSVMNIATAYASALSGFELSLQASDTPSYWQSGISVTVTVQ